MGSCRGNVGAEFLEPRQRVLRRTRDRICGGQACAQSEAIEEHLGKSKILRDIVDVQIVESDYCRAMKRPTTEWHGIGEMNDVTPQLLNEPWQANEIPEISA